MAAHAPAHTHTTSPLPCPTESARRCSRWRAGGSQPTDPPSTSPPPLLLQDLAVFTVESKWRPNKPLEAQKCYGTTSIEHPGVQMISMERGKYYLGESCCFPHVIFYLSCTLSTCLLS